MIKPPETVKPLLGLSRRHLLIGIAVIALIFVTVHVVHGSVAKKTAHNAPHQVVAACVVHRSGRHAMSCPARAFKPAKHHPSRHPKRAHPAPIHHQVAPVIRLTALQLYARHLLPTLVRSGPLFAQAELAAESSASDTLSSGCSWYGDKIHALTDEVDGVPHPGSWYGSVSALHYQVLGVYHDMTSALLVCVTGADSGDDSAIATARHDLGSAIAQLHTLRNHIWWVGYRQA